MWALSCQSLSCQNGKIKRAVRIGGEDRAQNFMTFAVSATSSQIHYEIETGSMNGRKFNDTLFTTKGKLSEDELAEF